MLTCQQSVQGAREACPRPQLAKMGRGISSKGKRSADGPDWLGPSADGGGGGGGERVVQEEKPKRRPRKGDDDDDFGPPKKGIQWKPLAFLILMVLPGLAPVVINVLDGASVMGFKMPGSSFFSPNPYRPCLQEFYADWAPEKLGGIDDALSKYQGREKQLFGALSKKYGKKANFAKCVPPKPDKKSSS